MPSRRSAAKPSWDDPLITALRTLIGAAGGLTVFANAAAGRAPASLINAGLVEHPVSGAPTLAHVAYGASRRVARLAVDGTCSLTLHDGRKWLTAEGRAELVFGPWDERAAAHEPALDLDADRYGELLRAIYRSAGGGEHPDWAEYDSAMRAEGRVAVLVEVRQLYGIHWD